MRAFTALLLCAGCASGCRSLPAGKTDAAADTPAWADICRRTQQVRDSILDALGADDCAAVDSEGAGEC